MTERAPADEGLLLLVEGDAEVLDIYAALKPLGVKVLLPSRFELVLQEVKDLLLSRGISYVWQLTRLHEAVLPAGQPAATLVNVLNQMISRLAPTQEFIVADPYLLHTSKEPGYRQRLFDVLAPIAQRVDDLLIITNQKYDSGVLTDLFNDLKAHAPKCRLRHRTSELFHDRFWIADSLRGLIVGTSLNGLGKRYAIVDYMQESDTADIMQALRTEGLV